MCVSALLPQGLGLYAARDIEKHTMVIEYIGTIIRNEVANRKEKLYESQVSVCAVTATPCRPRAALVCPRAVTAAPVLPLCAPVPPPCRPCSPRAARPPCRAVVTVEQ